MITQKEVRELAGKAMEINSQVDAMAIQVCKELGGDKQPIQFPKNQQPTFVDGAEYFTILTLKLVGEEDTTHFVGNVQIENFLDGTSHIIENLNLALYPINNINLLACLALMLND